MRILIALLLSVTTLQAATFPTITVNTQDVRTVNFTMPPGTLLGNSSQFQGPIEALVNLMPILGLAFSPVYSMTEDYRWGGGLNGTYSATSSSFSAWGQGIGTYTNTFNSLRVIVRPFDAGFIPTTMAVRLKTVQATWSVVTGQILSGATNPSTWTTIIAVTNSYPSLNVLQENTITVNFGQNITTTSNLWFEIQANGRIGLAVAAFSPSPDYTVTPSPAYMTGSSLTSTNWNSATAGTSKEALVILGMSPGEISDYTVSETLSEKLGVTNEVTFSLCPTNYATSGTEFNLYFRNVTLSDTPISDLNFDVTCNKGAQYTDFFRVTPVDADAGTYDLALTSSSYNYEATYNGKLKIVADSAGNGVTRKLLVIGDSTTAGGQVVTELNLISNTNGFKLDTIGTQGSSTNKHEGRSGWTLAMFYSGADGAASPFTNGAGAFSFEYYLTNNSLTMASNDWVFVNLGINDIFGQTDDAGALTASTAFLTTFSNLAVNVRATVPGIRVGLCVTIPPAFSQDAFGDDYGTGKTFYRYNRNRAILAENQSAYTQTGVLRIPISIGLDTLHNFASTTSVWNSRNSGTWVYLNNGVHPDQSGYEQIADQMWAALKCLEP